MRLVVYWGREGWCDIGGQAPMIVGGVPVLPMHTVGLRWLGRCRATALVDDDDSMAVVGAPFYYLVRLHLCNVTINQMGELMEGC